MRVSGSILAAKGDYFEYARMLQYANVDYLHIDIFQHDSRFSIEQLAEFDTTYLPLDVHLIYEHLTDEDIDILNKSNVKFLDIQYENLKNKEEILEISKKFDGNFGIAITSRTPLTVIDEYINYISQALFMCSEPGISGAEFDESNFERISKLHENYPSLELFADGGINNFINEEMGKCGISMVVSGSYLCKDFDGLDMNTYRLKYLNERNVNVTRNMIKKIFLPVISRDDCFSEIINTMNQYRMGIVFITSDDQLEGIIADGDIRRGFIEFGENIFRKTAADLMNSHPITIENDKNIDDIFRMLSTMHKGIDVLPVIEKNKLIGAVDLHVGL